MMGVKIEVLSAVANIPHSGQMNICSYRIQGTYKLQRHSIHLCSIGLYFSNHIVDVRLRSLKLAHWFSSISYLGPTYDVTSVVCSERADKKSNQFHIALSFMLNEWACTLFGCAS